MARATVESVLNFSRAARKRLRRPQKFPGAREILRMEVRPNARASESASEDFPILYQEACCSARGISPEYERKLAAYQIAYLSPIVI